MDTLKTNESLDILQNVINDVLVQTGKAIRATTKDGSGSLTQGPGPAQFKLPDSMRTFHSALDDLENEIIKAKSILQRDISRLQSSRMTPVKPAPVESQTKSPMVIDSSPPSLKMEEPEPQGIIENQSVAPFPDMGMDMPDIAPKEDFETSVLDSSNVLLDHGIAENDFSAPVPMMDQEEPGPQNGTSGPAESTFEAPASDLNFTTMQFSLASPEDGQQPDTTAAPEAFGDLTAYNAVDGANNGVSGDLSLGLLPVDANNQVQNDPNSSQGAAVGSLDQGDAAAVSVTGDALGNMLDMDFDGDGNDFDFGIEEGEFNELMNSGNFDTTMEHGQFDEEFFGIGKPDGT